MVVVGPIMAFYWNNYMVGFDARIKACYPTAKSALEEVDGCIEVTVFMGSLLVARRVSLEALEAAICQEHIWENLADNILENFSK